MAEIQRKGTAADDVLISQGVENQAVGLALLESSLEIRSQAHDAGGDAIALGDEAKGLVDDGTSAHSDGVNVVSDLGAGLSAGVRSISVVESSSSNGANGRSATLGRVVLASSETLLGLGGRRSGSTVRVDPELRGAGIEQDSDLLSRSADRDYFFVSVCSKE